MKFKHFISIKMNYQFKNKMDFMLKIVMLSGGLVSFITRIQNVHY